MRPGDHVGEETNAAAGPCGIRVGAGLRIGMGSAGEAPGSSTESERPFGHQVRLRLPSSVRSMVWTRPRGMEALLGARTEPP